MLNGNRFDTGKGNYMILFKSNTGRKLFLIFNFSPLLSPVAMDTFDDILCPTIGGRLLLYVRLKQDGCLLQVITIVRDLPYFCRELVIFKGLRFRAKYKMTHSILIC